MNHPNIRVDVPRSLHVLFSRALSYIQILLSQVIITNCVMYSDSVITLDYHRLCNVKLLGPKLEWAYFGSKLCQLRSLPITFWDNPAIRDHFLWTFEEVPDDSHDPGLYGHLSKSEEAIGSDQQVLFLSQPAGLLADLSVCLWTLMAVSVYVSAYLFAYLSDFQYICLRCSSFLSGWWSVCFCLSVYRSVRGSLHFLQEKGTERYLFIYL